MFDISWGEMLLIGVVALIAIGPKELPGVLRMVGQWMAKARRMAAEFQGQFREAMREAELADLKKEFDDVTKSTGDLDFAKPISSLQQEVEESLKAGLPQDMREGTLTAADAGLDAPAEPASTPPPVDPANEMSAHSSPPSHPQPRVAPQAAPQFAPEPAAESADAAEPVAGAGGGRAS
jgi:sec-independent protein translocase protein TatB